MSQALLPIGGRQSFWIRLRLRIADGLDTLAQRVRGGPAPNVAIMETREITTAAQIVDEGERLTVDQSAALLGVSRRTIGNLVKRGKLEKHTADVAGAHGLRVYFMARQVEGLRAIGATLKPKRKRKAKGKGSRKRRKA